MNSLRAGGVDTTNTGARVNLLGCLLEPIPPHVTHVSPLNVACFPHRRGREGKNKRHNSYVNRARKKGTTKRHARAIWKSSNVFLTAPKVSATLQTWRQEGAEMLMLTEGKVATRTPTVTVNMECNHTVLVWEVDSYVALGQMRKDAQRAALGGRTTLYNHLTAVQMRERWCCECCRAKCMNTRHTAQPCICWQAKLLRPIVIQ